VATTAGILAIAAMVVACSGTSALRSGGSGGPPGASVAPQSVPPSIDAGQPSASTGLGEACPAGAGDAEAAIKASASAQLAAPSYRADTALTRHDGQKGLSTIEYVAPDRLHMTFTSPELGQTTEMIQIGSNSWLKINGKWTKSPAIDVREILGISRQLTEAARITNASIVGSEQVGPDATTVYHFVADFSGNGAIATSDAKLWVRNGDCLPVKLESSIKPNVPGATGTEQVLETFSKWGAVTIEPPA
jgi:hypothetical protein